MSWQRLGFCSFLGRYLPLQKTSSPGTLGHVSGTSAGGDVAGAAALSELCAAEALGRRPLQRGTPKQRGIHSDSEEPTARNQQ